LVSLNNLKQFIQILVSLASWVFPELRLQWLVDETRKNLPQELDFAAEAANAERIRLFYSFNLFFIDSDLHTRTLIGSGFPAFTGPSQRIAFWSWSLLRAAKSMMSAISDGTGWTPTR
jgi:hypothetical protein